MNRASPRIYLDYAASTPVDPEVLRAMMPYFTKKFGNPGSLHSFGQEAMAAIDASREIISRVIGADFRKIIFTGSATEANNLALRGVVARFRIQDSRFRKDNLINHESRIMNPRVIISSIEHESVLETARELEKEGIEVVYLPVNHAGSVDLKNLKESLTPNTVLVSVMHANNEIGTIQSIREIAKIIRDFREQITNHKSQMADGHRPFVPSHWPLFHTDAAQTLQFLDCNVQYLGVDLMTLSAHKIYGPKGAGCLYARSAGSVINVVNEVNSITTARTSTTSTTLSPLLLGGGQEFGLRSGTENVPAIVGFARAVQLINHSRELESKRIKDLRDHLWRGIRKIYPKAEVNGETQMANRKGRIAISHQPSAISILPNILNVYFPNCEAQDLLTRFDLAGLAASSGSACRSRAMESSYVIEALGHSKQCAKSSIRFSLGRPTTKKEIDEALQIMKKTLG